MDVGRVAVERGVLRAMARKVLITGGAGYIGSCLTGHLLDRGDEVTVLDDLWFGGESLLPFKAFKKFRLIKTDLCTDGDIGSHLEGVDCVIHLAALVGFPVCDKRGRDATWRINVECTKRVYEQSLRAGVSRLVFASSYSNYGESCDGEPVTEDSPLHPKSTYAESKIEAEQFLLRQTDPDGTAPVCLRLATVFGLSPRTRFDLMVNQFVFDAFTTNRLRIYQEDFKRSFVYVGDVVRAMMCVMDAPLELVRNQIFNVGSERLNMSKQELAKSIGRYAPGLEVEHLNTSFPGDMRNIHVSFEKIRQRLAFEARVGVEEGIEELLRALREGVISDPSDKKYRNHPPILV